MKKVYQIFHHTVDKYKFSLYSENYYKTKKEALETIDKWGDDDEVIVILPVYITEKRYKWIFDEM